MSRNKSNAKLKMVSIKKILVPFDFSQYSSNALREAISIAKVFSAKIELIHVITPVYAAVSDNLVPGYDVFYNKLMRKAKDELMSIAKEVERKNTINVAFKTKLGPIHVEILQEAEKTDADLIVMGTHGTSGFKEFFAGSNAYRIVQNAPCPVLTIQKKLVSSRIKSIVLPIRLEINSRQKVELVATLAKIYSAKILVTGYLKENDKSDEFKIKRYCNQVEKLLNKESIAFKTTIIKDQNFTKAIVSHAKRQKADVIAIMTTHNFSLDQLVRGPYAGQFVNHSKIPILSVPDRISFDYSYTPSLSGGYQNN